MKRSIFVACLCAAVLAGCGKTVVRETVVERPIVKETVIERPAVTRETIVTAPASCALGGTAYATGTLSCQAGLHYRCNNGAWERIPGSMC